MKRFIKTFGIILSLFLILASLVYSVCAVTVEGSADRRNEDLTYSFDIEEYRILYPGQEEEWEKYIQKWLKEYNRLLEHSQTCNVCGENGIRWNTTVSHLGHSGCGMDNRFEVIIGNEKDTGYRESEYCSEWKAWATLLNEFAKTYYGSDVYNINFNNRTWGTIVTDCETWILNAVRRIKRWSYNRYFS